MDFCGADAIAAPLLLVTEVSIGQLVEPSQGCDVDVDQLAWPLLLVALHEGLGLESSETPQHKPAEALGTIEERTRCRQVLWRRCRHCWETRQHIAVAASHKSAARYVEH
jgi:hypothetical protein